MAPRLAGFFFALRQAYSGWRKDNSQFVAGGLSFFAIFSMLPLGIITTAVLGRVFAGTPAKGLLLSKLADIFSPDAAQSAAAIMAHAEFSGVKAGLFSGVVLMWAGSRVFIQLQRALSDAWQIPAADLTRVEKFTRFVLNRFRALAATLGLGVATLLFLGVDLAVGTFRDLVGQIIPTVWVFRIIPAVAFLSSIVLFTVLFAMIYRWLPNAHPGWPAVWAGAAVASGLFAVGRFLLAFYLAALNVLSLFGAAGSVIVILIWVYTSMQILLFGAKFAWIVGLKHLEHD